MEKIVRGIVLQVQPYGERAWIVALWTAEFGRLGVYADRGSVRKGGEAVLTVLNELEMVLGRRRPGGLWRCQEVRLVSGHLALRSEFVRLQGAFALLQGVFCSQMPERAAPALYALFCDYLKRLEQGASPWGISTSFYLKILRHEGVWSDELMCSTCQALLPPLYLCQGEVWCQRHAAADAVVIDTEEWQRLWVLAYCRTGDELAAASPDEALWQKALAFFNQRLV